MHQGFPIVRPLDALNAQRRHRIHITGHLELGGIGQNIGIKHLDPSLGRTENEICMGHQTGLVGIRTRISPYDA